MRRRLVFAGVIVVAVLATAGVAMAANGGFTPQHAHSPNAHRINQAYYLISGFTVAIFLLVETALVVFIVKYRSRGRGRTVEGSQVHGHTRIEVVWTVIPIVIIGIIFGFVFYKLPGISGVPKAAAGTQNLKIKIDAHQFYWQFTYPNGAISIDDVHLPVGRVAEFEIRSEDVDHSWWIPQLGGKTDAIPGKVNHTWYQPAKTGTYYGQCAEFCGIFHEKMLMRAIVTSDADYRSYTGGGASKDLGRAEWAGVCAKCHASLGQGDYGPAINANPTLVQPAGLETIVRKGRGRMPGVGSNWTEQQMKALEQYVKAKIYKGATTSGG